MPEKPTKFYANEMATYKTPPTKEFVLRRMIDLMPDFIEKVVEGRSLEHSFGIFTALRDQRIKAREGE